MKQYYIFTRILIFLFAACEKEIEFKGDSVEPLLVLNGLLTPDTEIVVHLSESRFFLSSEQGFTNVHDAQLTLWKNGDSITTLKEYEYGYYIAPYRTKTGDQLRITASAPGLNPVECSTEILPAPEILSVEMAEPSNDRFDYEVSLTLKDPVEIANFYRMNMYLRLYFNDERYIDLPVRFQSDDVVFSSSESIPMGTFGNRYRVFTDDLFNGNEYTLKMQIRIRYEEEDENENPYYDYGDYGEPAYIELYVDLQHITKDYYLYLKSRAGAWGSGDMGGMFTEPVQIYTNIRGGIGILGSYASAIYKLSL